MGKSTAQQCLAIPEGPDSDEGQGDPEAPKESVPFPSVCEHRVARASIVVYEVHAEKATEELERHYAHCCQREDVENVLLPAWGGIGQRRFDRRA